MHEMKRHGKDFRFGVMSMSIDFEVSSASLSFMLINTNHFCPALSVAVKNYEARGGKLGGAGNMSKRVNDVSFERVRMTQDATFFIKTSE
nr:hypothetical protein [Tanacetum cinerariifolium]